ncbi:MAG: type II toxin-antitoxin system Phd/YefM family antitoxin [Actinobacteria bacterium]|nr:type II toxin-antitoxin system Phd/YefM family antitoxin [Actinomycetota bacterium]MCL6104151.1 type II toxin-antitoxin system Phd/YefM family antitoxin [Actinomycetota bacterium]
MKQVNALQLRQSMGKVVEGILRTGEPVILEKGRKPVAVLISIKDFEERFVEKAAAEARQALLAEIETLSRVSSDTTSSVDILREARGGI